MIKTDCKHQITTPLEMVHHCLIDGRVIVSCEGCEKFERETYFENTEK